MDSENGTGNGTRLLVQSIVISLSSLIAQWMSISYMI